MIESLIEIKYNHKKKGGEGWGLSEWLSEVGVLGNGRWKGRFLTW